MILLSLLTLILRVILHKITLSMNYYFIDKNNYNNVLSQQQIERESSNWMSGFIIHFFVQNILQFLFPLMFQDNYFITCALYTLIMHIFVVEPLYWVAHYMLHTPYFYKSMHKFHHMSVSTIPTTGVVQNNFEHLVYLITFGPAMLFPYFITGYQHWLVILLYLLCFDIFNAYGHLNDNYNSWFNKYIFYNPQFHNKHHTSLKCNYALFMPIWDHIFGTYKEPKDFDTNKCVSQDFVFIGHNCGLFHWLNIPEFNFYNIYSPCKFPININIDFIIIKIISEFLRLLGFKNLKLPVFKVGENKGRVISLNRTPIDYLKNNNKINVEIKDLIQHENKINNTKYFGLGNLNKSYSLNNGGKDLILGLPKDTLLWTGDSMTCAVIYNYIIDNNINDIYYIGGTGKIGSLICEMLYKKNIRVTIFSSSVDRANKINCHKISTDINDINNYKNIVIGKYHKLPLIRDKNIYDYTVPFIPIPNNNHIQLCIVKCPKNILKGYYDICFGLPQNHIYACYAGCLINLLSKRETHEVGDVKEEDVHKIWELSKQYGFSANTDE